MSVLAKMADSEAHDRAGVVVTEPSLTWMMQAHGHAELLPATPTPRR